MGGVNNGVKKLSFGSSGDEKRQGRAWGARIDGDQARGRPIAEYI